MEKESKLKVLNLYSGLGGNRKLWTNVDVTAIENNETIAKYYIDNYPNDEVIITDAHKYLIDNYYKYDVIWSSFPCQSHSRARFWSSKPNNKVKPIYPNLGLYEEILFLQHYFNGNWVVENVTPFYKPLVEPTIKIGRHLFWSNKFITQTNVLDADIKNGNIKEWQELHQINIDGYKFNTRKDQLLRNCVNPLLGEHILKHLK